MRQLAEKRNNYFQKFFIVDYQWLADFLVTVQRKLFSIL